MTSLSDLESLNFGFSMSPVVSTLSPLVPTSILDHYLRRPEAKQQRVIGTLLGYCERQRIYVTNAFGVPFTEIEDRKEFDPEYEAKMSRFYTKGSGDVVVGFFQTSTEIDEVSMYLYMQYAKKYQQQLSGKVRVITPLEIS